jgi:hypothetical protein
MQKPARTGLLECEFVGVSDPTIWLEEHNGEHNPLVIPLWPDDFPEHLAVYMCESGETGVALTRDAMLQACQQLLQREPVLWFCNIPKDTLLAATDADHSLFA